PRRRRPRTPRPRCGGRGLRGDAPPRDRPGRPTGRIRGAQESGAPHSRRLRKPGHGFDARAIADGGVAGGPVRVAGRAADGRGGDRRGVAAHGAPRHHAGLLGGPARDRAAGGCEGGRPGRNRSPGEGRRVGRGPLRRRGVVLYDSRASDSAFAAAMTAAFRHRDRLPEIERYLATGRYYEYYARADDGWHQATAAYRSALERDPDNIIALNDLSRVLWEGRRYQEAETLAV